MNFTVTTSSWPHAVHSNVRQVVSAIAARLDASKRSSGAAFGARRPYVEVK